jgi:hypothetical protein
VLVDTILEFPLQGRLTHTLKLTDNASGNIYSIGLDVEGNEISIDDLIDQERYLYRQQFGALDPDLRDHLYSISENERITVLIWLVEPWSSLPPRPITELIPTTENSEELGINTETLRSFINQLTSPLAQKIQELDGVGDIQTFLYVPAILATLQASTVFRLAAWEQIDTIYWVGSVGYLLNDANAAVEAAPLYNALGLTGRGVQVAIVEGGGAVDLENPYLASIELPRYGSVGVPISNGRRCGITSDHKTEVALVIRSTHQPMRGIAPGVTLWEDGICGRSVVDNLRATEDAVTWGARIVNLSWYATSTIDRFYDSLTLNTGVLFVAGAGNRVGSDSVVSPASSYNVIAVGAYNDRNTYQWNDDIIANFSSFDDPLSLHGDREKPDIVAPGVDITFPLPSSAYTASDGTSFSAPIVTGGTALLMEDDVVLRIVPTAVRALLMATSIHNIEGSEERSDFDGTGGVAFLAARLVQREIYGRYGVILGFNDCSRLGTDVVLATMPLSAGNPVRVAVAWNTNPSYLHYDLQPSTDLDLIVERLPRIVSDRRPSHRVFSNTFDNTFEIVEFTPPQTDSYSIRIHSSRCSIPPFSIAWAWFQENYPWTH